MRPNPFSAPPVAVCARISPSYPTGRRWAMLKMGWKALVIFRSPKRPHHRPVSRKEWAAMAWQADGGTMAVSAAAGRSWLMWTTC